SKFLHFGTLNGGTDTGGKASIYAGGLAYAFAMDETPITDVGEAMANPLGGPSKMDGTVPDGATLSLIVNPWGQAAPIVTGLNKPQGSVNGGTEVTISGAGFNATSTVMFGSVAATNVRYQSASGGQPAALIVTSPPQTAGSADIIVMTGQSTSASAAAPKFIYVSTAQPIVHPSTTPLAADAGTLTILGEHFSSIRAGNVVTLSSGTAIVQSVTATSITLLFTSRPTAGPLTATVKVGGASSGVVQVAAVYATVKPAMASLAATAKTIVLMGTGFDTKTRANNVVTLSSGAGVVTKATATALTISLTTAPQIGPLSVTALQVRGVETLGLPVEVAAVVPGPASARSTMTTIAAQATVGDPVAVTLQAVDALGNLVTAGGAKVRFAASAAGTFSKVTDNGDGTYTASFTTKRVGPQIYYATANGLKVTETATTRYFIAQFTHPIPGTDWSVKRGGFVAVPFAVIATAATNNVAIYKGAAARNVTVASSVENLDDGQFGGLVARYSSKTSYYRAGLMLESGQYYAVIQAVGLTGVRTLAKQTVAGPGEGYVSFRVNGSSLSLTLNGSQVAEVTDNRLKSGRVGMSGSQAVRFANFNAG
ncbi:MAG: invasin domain 3-containing protein, partial [Planctomycetia bacterium]